MATETIEVDSRGRAALGKVAQPNKTYRATTKPDGSILLEPARLVTEAELAVIARPELMKELAATFDGTAETVAVDWE
ncbi:MAG: hypothetical protein LBL01_04120 [Bifidobacteriaceae bacterium]|jgi:hypothetical protein|nr:hypothetical protein [Bifidobacteriaceae bacterium]